MINTGALLDRYFIKQPRLRRLVTAFIEPDRNLQVDLAGASLQVNSRREHGYLRASRLLRRNGTLRDEIPVLMNLFALLRNGDTFVDVGANVGLFTHAVERLTRLHPQLELVAIEAHPDTFARLSARPLERVRYLNLAMGTEAGTLTFVDGAVSHVFTTVDQQNAYSIPSEIRRVPSQRLDALAFRPGSELVLKVDVEGQERQVLEGAADLFAAGRIRVVYLDGYDDPALAGWLRDRGFSLRDGRTLEPTDQPPFSLLAIRS